MDNLLSCNEGAWDGLRDRGVASVDVTGRQWTTGTTRLETTGLGTTGTTRLETNGLVTTGLGTGDAWEGSAAPGLVIISFSTCPTVRKEAHCHRA